MFGLPRQPLKSTDNLKLLELFVNDFHPLKLLSCWVYFSVVFCYIHNQYMIRMCVICLLLFCHLALPNVKLVCTHTTAVLAILAAFTVMVHMGHTVFTALHVMQTRYCDDNSVCLSVCLSVRLSHACIVTKRKKDLSRFIYHTKEHLA